MAQQTRASVFKISGMDCVDEVAALKSAVGPVVGGQEQLAFDVLNGRMVVTAQAGHGRGRRRRGGGRRADRHACGTVAGHAGSAAAVANQIHADGTHGGERRPRGCRLPRACRVCGRHRRGAGRRRD